jgi:hypothetical protein
LALIGFYGHALAFIGLHGIPLRAGETASAEQTTGNSLAQKEHFGNIL